MESNKSITNSRILYLDVIRCLACVMVVAMHSPMPGIGTSGLVLSSISFLCAPCIGLFFMVSGALLLPMKGTDSSSFLKKRLTKIVIPTLIWTAVYVIRNILTGKESLHDLPHILASIPFSAQGDGILWFVYVLIGLYLLVPILSPWLEKASRRELHWALGLWGITLLYPLLKMVLEVNESPSGPLYYFCGYAGYFILGHYLHRFRPIVTFWAIAILILAPILAAVWCKLANIEVDFYSVFWYLSIFVVMMAVGWFLLLQRTVHGQTKPSKVTSIVVSFSQCSFGIYLMHILIMRSLLWKVGFISEYGGIMQIFMTTILTLLLSWGVTYAISLLPGGAYLVGKNRAISCY